MTLKSQILSQTEVQRINYLDRLDWELEYADTIYATHSYHPYSAKFIPQIPNYLISNFSMKNDLILDNFMGSGTTLVESKILGRNAIGVDINPLACLIAKVKTTNIQSAELKEIEKISMSIREDVLNIHGTKTLLNFEDKRMIIDESFIKSLHPNIPKWFHGNVIRDLFVIKSRIDSVENNDAKDFLLVAFSSILRSVSNATSGFGNLMINKHAAPKNRIYEKFAIAVKDMINSLYSFNEMTTSKTITKTVDHDTRSLEFINDETIDFICTHPPYMAAVPYAEYHKLSLWWLGFSQYELEIGLIGGRRSRSDTPNRFFQDMFIVLAEMKRVLIKKKYCSIIIGNPVYNGKVWKLNEVMKKDAKELGFILLKEISRGKYRSTMGKMKEEFILIFRNE